jgi:hypothetical protein
MSTALQSFGIELVTGMVIRSGTGGDKAKEAARAAELAAMVGALQQVNNGQVAVGLTALQAALVTTAMDPGEALAFQSFMSFVATQAAALQSVAGGTLLGQLQTAVFNNVATAVLATCAAYGTVAPAA